MLLLGIDIGTSSVKVSVVDAETHQVVAAAQFPDEESPIIALQPGWAEQSPEMWWEQTQKAFEICQKTPFDTKDVAAIGIAYQMHGLVIVDKDQQVLRDSIIWCDSRAVATGNKAFETIGEEYCLTHLLNSPGNFTASKLAWVKENEPDIYAQIDKVILPGDFIAMKLTGAVITSASALSEGVFFDFQNNGLSKDVTDYFGFDESLFPQVQSVFSEHGQLRNDVAQQLNLTPGIPVSYKSGDQPNNALSLNVMEPGEVAATAGTSGVIYAISDKLTYDLQSRVNTFAHVNHSAENKRLGVLLCINGVGSMYRWLKSSFGNGLSYLQLNDKAKQAPPGSDGLLVLPFGNGAERILNNKLVGAHFLNIDLNKHSQAHIIRATLEGIAFAFRYGLDIMRENGLNPKIIRAGQNNLFLSEVFTTSFVNITGVPVELYKNDGSAGAALGAGIGAGIFETPEAAFKQMHAIQIIHPDGNHLEIAYQKWKELLIKQLEDD